MLLGLHVMCPLTPPLTWVTNFVEPIGIDNPRLNLNGNASTHPREVTSKFFQMICKKKKGVIYHLKVNFIILSKKVKCRCLWILHLNKYNV